MVSIYFAKPPATIIIMPIPATCLIAASRMISIASNQINPVVLAFLGRIESAPNIIARPIIINPAANNTITVG